MRNLLKKIIYHLFAFRTKFILRKKISTVYKSITKKRKIKNTNIKKHCEVWSKLGSKPNLKWHRVYASINNNYSPYYITEIDYYNKVELILNNRSFSEAFSDKNSYHRFIDSNLLPKIYIRNIQGAYYSEDYENLQIPEKLTEIIPKKIKEVIIKRSIDSGGGRGIQLFCREGDKFINKKKEELSISLLEKIYRDNFIIQEHVKQHPYFSQFNESSVNTVRLFTYRSVKTNKIISLQSVLRIGKPGAIVDNQASGGISCGIRKDGALNSFAVNKKGEKFESYNGLSFKYISSIYKYNEIVSLGLEIAKKYYFHRLLGFDFCVDINGNVKLIEINIKNNEINFFQMNNGPLFREYTEEIIEYCSKSKKNLCFDFDV